MLVRSYLTIDAVNAADHAFFPSAEKYKLYKKLNRVKTQPLTPPKQQQKQLIPKSQAVKTEPYEASTNPFSPVKNKGSRAIRVEQTRPISTPFSTPRKEAKRREPSPDPFPLIQSAASSSQVTLPSQPTSAISRARKRLRGEPVSPSPVKPKRPRVIPSGGPIPFLPGRPFDSDEENDYSDGEFNGPSGPALFEETPRKDRSGNRSFTSLFNEDDRMIQPNFSLDTTQSRSAPWKAAGPGPPTGTRDRSTRQSLSDEDDDGPARVLPHTQAQTQPLTRQKLKPSDVRADRRANAFNISSRLASSGRNNLLDQDPRLLRSVSALATSGTKSNVSTSPSTPDHSVSKLPPTSSAPTSDAELDDGSDPINDTKGKGKNRMSLIAVSPPPSSLTSASGYGNSNVKVKGKGRSGFTSGSGKWKGKGKASARTPIWTLAGDGSEDEGFDDEGDFPTVRVYQGRNPASREGDASGDVHSQGEEIIDDLISGIKRRIPSPDPDPSHFPSRVCPQDGDMIVNLRDEFRTVLDLNANAAPLETAGGGIIAGGKGEYVRHARVVRAVRDGTRVIGMFDPTRGGHIWGVGETEREADADLGTEDFQFGLGYAEGGEDDYDDWEGEGVPWEVAELEHDNDDETRL